MEETVATRLYEKRTAVYPKAVDGTFRRLKWVILAVTLTVYYVTPWLRWDRGPPGALGSPPLGAGPGGADRPRRSALLLLRDRDLAARILLCRGPADHGGDRPVPGHVRGRPGLVRLYLPADRLDRPLPACRAVHRRRSQRPDPSRPRALGAGQDRPARRQIFDMAGNRRRHRRRLDLLFRRRPDPGAGRLYRPGAL